MKTKHFKVTKLEKLQGAPKGTKLFQEAFSSPSRQHKINQNGKTSGEVGNFVMQIFEQLNKKLKRQQHTFEVQARDRVVLIELPDGQDGKLQQDVLQQWITDVCSKVFSSAFNTLSKDEMSYEQAKIFCSEGILRNIVLLTKQFKLTQNQMKIINRHIQQKIVPYMKKKYPMTESTDVNKTIDQSVKPIDNRQALQNDLLQKSGVIFRFREDKQNYNDLIMKFLNWIISSIDAKTSAEKNSKTVYQEYYQFISKLFQNVYDSKWMDTKTSNLNKNNQNPTIQNTPTLNNIGQKIQKNSTLKNIDQKVSQSLTQKNIDQKVQKSLTQKNIDQKVISQAQNERYKEQVKQYTNYAIGRKISKNVQKYTESQIKSGHLKIKSPAILRILTKWCQQLWQKFTTKNYFLDREQNVRIQEQGRESNTMFMWMKMPLNDLIQQEKIRIQQFMKEVQKNNYDQQSKLLLKQQQKDGFTHVERIQKACGKFAYKTVNNLHSYIVLYLNRIIHGLLWVSKELYDTKLSTKARWTSPPDLITFKIGDLMRCKLHSKEREILKIFQELQYISNKKPEEMKIIRIKNRLKLGTNDILINVIYKKKYLCELQLAVNAVKSKFIQTSNLFSHYVYQLGRTLFGPVTQLCSIWMSLDPRAPQYLQIINNQQRKIQQQPYVCPKGKHQLDTQDRPFVCNNCNKAYSHVNYIKKHKKCSYADCNYRICGICRLQREEQQVLKDDFLKNKQINQACCSILNIDPCAAEDEFPIYGVCVQIQSKEKKVQKFKKLEINRIVTIYGIENDYHSGTEKIIKIEDLIDGNSGKKFLKKYLVFKILETKGEQLINITEDRVKKDYIIPQKVKQIYKKQKQILSLIEENLDDQSCKIMIMQNYKSAMQKVKNMELADNKFTKISFITQNFPNLQRLQLSRNKINSIDTISKLEHMEKLNLRNNDLVSLPVQLCGLKKLKGLNIRNNAIKEFPKDFGQLVLLNKLQSDNNKFENLPESFSNLIELTFIDLSKNKLTKFPQQFRHFTKLKELLLSGNLLGEVPDWIGNFKNLITLDLSKTKLKVFPQAIYKLTTLKILKIQALQSERIQPDIMQIINLEELVIQMPKLQELPNQIFCLRNLQSLSIEDCKLKKLPSLLKCLENLKSLSLINNHLQSYEELRLMVKLQNLKLNGQNLSVLPEGIQDLVKLRTLSMDNNQFKEIPLIITTFKKLFSLSLTNNQLQDISEYIAQGLPDIQTILLDSNKFTKIPSAVKKWRKLKKASFKNNLVSKADVADLQTYIKTAQKDLLLYHQMSMSKGQSMVAKATMKLAK